VTSVDVDRVLDAIRSGVTAAADAAVHAEPTAATGCAGWRVHDLTRHLEAIAGAYVLWAGAALGGRIMTLRTGDELAAYNTAMLDRLPDLPTPEHVDRFRALATDHARLVAAGWDLPMARTAAGVPLTVGEHAIVAATEWHVHAWDLASGRDRRHEPGPATLVLCAAWDAVLAPALGADPNARPDTWTSLLTATGRTP
jgi:hypothetical protein